MSAKAGASGGGDGGGGGGSTGSIGNVNSISSISNINSISSGGSGAGVAAAERLRQLAAAGASVSVDTNVPCRRYFRSGLEMVRMANVYLEEGNLENAYILYIKYMTLFIEKIRKHPEYASVPSEMKIMNQAKLKEIMPKAEKLKAQLMEQYSKEYKKSLEEQKIKLKEAEERAKKQRKQEEQDERLAESLQADELRKFGSRDPDNSTTPLWTNVMPPNMQDVLYPDDFATEPNRAPPGHFDPTPPIISRQSKPKMPDTVPSAPYSGSLLGGGLRTIIVPSGLMDTFLKLSASNTKSNVETCGILAGKLERDQLLLTHMIVPKQTGTADSCTTKSEEEIFYYQDQHNLITLGWIHTHPTQTAFLSSVDLHTQCSYQLMMPEAIAIVCAPKYNETGYFGLTPHYGMSFIANCRQTGFHPHPNDPPLFKDVSHIKLDSQTKLEVIDLRR